MYWLYFAHLGTDEEVARDAKKLAGDEWEYRLTDDHEFLYENEMGDEPIGGTLVAIPFMTEEGARKVARPITLLQGEYKNIWKYSIFPEPPSDAHKVSTEPTILQKIRAHRDAIGSKLPLNHYRLIYEDKRIAQRILVFFEENCNRYFSAATPEETLRAFLQILIERYGPDAYLLAITTIIEEHQSHNKSEAPDFDEDSIIKLPVSMQEDARKKLEEHKKGLAAWDDQNERYHDIKRAVDEKNAELAYECSTWTHDGEYERWSFEYLEESE